MMTVEVTLLLLVLSISSKDILLFRRWKSPGKQLFMSFTNFLFKESSCSYLGAQVEGLLTLFSSLLTREHQQFKEELLASFSSPVRLNWCRILVFWSFLSLNAERWITGHHMVMCSFFWEFQCSLRSTRGHSDCKSFCLWSSLESGLIVHSMKADGWCWWKAGMWKAAP